MIPPISYPGSADTEVVPPANVLIVDDVAQNLVALGALLEGAYVKVLTASSGAQALELLLTHEVAVALLDVQMPEMNGFALAEFMRGSPRTSGIPIIFLTASPEDPLRAFQGYDAGAVDFLHKPVAPMVIQSKVATFVELHRQRQLLALRAARVEQALSLNETMLAVMTHDLRTPLSVVTLCADVLARQPPGSDVRVIGQRIGRSADRMNRMIEQLLEFSRIRSGVLRLEYRVADLGVVATQVIDEVRQAHPGQELRLVLDGPLTGRFDPDRMAQVLSNLVSNAVQHVGDSPVLLALDGSSTDSLRVEVHNAGTIAEELMPRLFEPFKGMLHAGSGLGLGLYIVDQFTRAHGGTVTARSSDGQVTLSLRIPRHAAAEEDARPIAASPASVKTRASDSHLMQRTLPANA